MDGVSINMIVLIQEYVSDLAYWNKNRSSHERKENLKSFDLFQDFGTKRTSSRETRRQTCVTFETLVGERANIFSCIYLDGGRSRASLFLRMGENRGLGFGSCVP